MSLEDTGMRAQTATGINARAKDGEGRTVVVATTDEAISDHGWPAIWQAAADKYDRDEFTLNGATRTVRVTAAECEDNA